jgi:hypothetical protein
VVGTGARRTRILFAPRGGTPRCEASCTALTEIHTTKETPLLTPFVIHRQIPVFRNRGQNCRGEDPARRGGGAEIFVRRLPLQVDLLVILHMRPFLARPSHPLHYAWGSIPFTWWRTRRAPRVQKQTNLLVLAYSVHTHMHMHTCTLTCTHTCTCTRAHCTPLRVPVFRGCAAHAQRHKEGAVIISLHFGQVGVECGR